MRPTGAILERARVVGAVSASPFVARLPADAELAAEARHRARLQPKLHETLPLVHATGLFPRHGRSPCCRFSPVTHVSGLPTTLVTHVLGLFRHLCTRSVPSTRFGP